MLDAQQLELTRDRLSALDHKLDLRIDLGPDPGDKFPVALKEVVNQLVQVSGGKLEVVTVDEPPGRYPSLQVKNIEYLAVPLDRELEPFLDLLLFLANGVELQPVEGLEPARVELLVAPTCPNCPAVVRACGQAAAVMPQLKMVVVDVQYFTELAGSCRSVPTVIIDGALTVVGPLTTQRLIDLLNRRREPEYALEALASMLEAGRLNEMGPLLQSDDGFAALATIMGDGSMQQKMGLMLAVEQLVEDNPHCMDGAVPRLLPLLSSDVVTLRGDTADLLGKIGAPGAREALSRLLTDEDPDVREVAEEALEMLRDPS